jgi:hypothetical protein
MSGVEFTAAMSVVISAILLLVLCCLYSGYRADNLRDHLFTLRDEMFLYALDHGIAETPAHENLRLMMNSLIRYAHRVSLARLMLLEISRRVLKLKPSLPATYIEWVEAVKALPPDGAERMREFHAKAMLLIMTHMITGSPLLWPAFPLVMLHDVISKSTRAFIDRTVSAVSRRVPSVDLFEVDALSRPVSGRSGLFAAG